MSDRKSPSVPWLVTVLLVVATLSPAADGDEPRGPKKTWTTSTFRDFVHGTLSDGGANTYIAADGTIRLINLRDLNDDGRIDLVFPQTHDHNENVEVRIFWSENGYQPDRRTDLPTDGGTSTMVADLNRDGWPELIVVNRFNGTKTELDSYVYWGGERGYSAQNRSGLPTVGAQAAAAGDLNGDGHPDLVFANGGLGYHAPLDSFQKSFIYWGSADGFSADRRATLPTIHANDVKLADLNGDGHQEIVFANEGNDATESGVLIYWGHADGTYAPSRSTHLPGERSSAVEAADLNNDGFPEILLANAFRLKERIAGIYNVTDTVQVDSYVYWGSEGGYSRQRRTALPTVGACGIAVADFNHDDRPDIVFANGSGGTSTIYWNNTEGFAADRQSSLSAANASAVAAGDVNGDGQPELIFAQRHDGTSYDAESTIYWGSQIGFSTKRKTLLPTIGANHISIADLNRDGKPELIFAQEHDGTAGSDLDSWIYWGDEQKGYQPDRRTGLPTESTNHCAIADLDADGHVDLCFPGRRTLIYWGSEKDFARAHRTALSERNAFSAYIADFNRDGYLDVVLSEWSPGVDDMTLYFGSAAGYSTDNRFVFRIPSDDRVNWHTGADLDRDGWLDLIVPTWKGVVLYRNGPHGFDNDRKTVLPAAEVIASEVADLNQDGYLDIIVGNLFDTKSTTGKFRSFGGTAAAGTIVYWGSEHGYNKQRRLVLPSVGNADISAADLNGDGHIDLVLSSYHAGVTRSHPSYVYWNSASGFDARKVTMLPTNSASGNMVADFNQDGHRDILFACHSKDGNHRTDSFLYWGGPTGYSPKRRSQIPTRGPHFLMTVDAGSIYDRSDSYDYISVPYDAGTGSRLDSIRWHGDTPFRTRLEFQVRTAASRDALEQSPWSGPSGLGSVFTTSGGSLPAHMQTQRWLQYKASLISPDSVNTPILRSVSITFR